MTAPKRADLHLHTRFSDGTYEPEELVQKAHALNFGVIAVTDHDAVAGVPGAVAEGERLGLRVVAGTELSTIYNGRETHIVGLFIDIEAPELVPLIEKARLMRVRRVEQIIEKLNGLDVPVTVDDVLTEADEGSVGRPHVATTLVRAGLTSSVSESFDRFLGPNRPAYVPKWYPDPAACCRAIHGAGGVAVLAHPGDEINERQVVDLVAAGCRALEAYYPSYRKWLTEEYIRLAHKLDIGVSGGSDCHGDRKARVLLGSVSLPLELVDDLERRCERNQ